MRANLKNNSNSAANMLVTVRACSLADMNILKTE